MTNLSTGAIDFVNRPVIATVTGPPIAASTEASSVILETATDNESAIRLYEKNGYTLDRVYRHYSISLTQD